MKELLALLAGLTSPVSDTLPNKALYVDVKFKDMAELHRIVDDGNDVAGINYETNTITLVTRGSGLRNTWGLDVSGVRNVRTPDAEYKKPSDIERALKDIESEYPGLARVQSIGKTIEGRDIWAINLTNRTGNNGDKPTVLFDAMHHAREVMTPEIALDIASYLTSHFGDDAKVQKWMNSYSIWVIPMVNPDGNNRVWEEDSMWRKNARDNHGVDINRNYEYEWGACGGSSGSKTSQIYRGESAGSEPETQAMEKFTTELHPVFNISYHSFSEIVIYPYGCSPKTVADKHRKIYEGTGQELAKRLKRDSGSGTYKAGTSYELLYNVDGGSIDWMYAKELVMSYVIEVNSTSQGFQPSYAKWREKTVEGQRAGWMYILDQMDKPGIRN